MIFAFCPGFWIKETGEVELHTYLRHWWFHALSWMCLCSICQTPKLTNILSTMLVNPLLAHFSTPGFLKAINHILVLPPRNFSELVLSCISLERESLKNLSLFLCLVPFNEFCQQHEIAKVSATQYLNRYLSSARYHSSDAPWCSPHYTSRDYSLKSAFCQLIRKDRNPVSTKLCRKKHTGKTEVGA